MKLKRLLSLLLAAVMTICLGATAAAEETKRDYSGYNTYVCLGDSIASGYKDDGSVKTGFYIAQKNAYHTLVSKEIDAKLIQLAHDGLRTCDVLYMLDEDFGSSANDDYLSKMLVSDVYNLSSKKLAKIREEVASADIITLEVGANDYLVQPIVKATISLREDSELAPYIDEFQKNIAAGENLAVALSKFFDSAQNVGKLSKAFAAVSADMASGYADFLKNYPQIVNSIYELNPDVTLVLLGQYFLTSYSENGEYKQLASLLKRTADAANYNIKLTAQKHGSVYVDLQGIDGPFHPSDLGQKQIFERIIAELPDRASEIKDPDTSEEIKLPFTDVPENYWAYDDIAYCYKNGLMIGKTETTFSPASEMTRAQLATVLYRIAGSPDASKLSEPFDDVSDSYWARDGIAWAYNNGIIKGFTNTRFNPDDSVSRQQMVAMLYRYAVSICGVSFEPNGDELDGYKDVASVDEYAKEAFAWAVSEGIIKGFTDTELGPDGVLTRAQCATILARFDRTVVK